MNTADLMIDIVRKDFGFLMQQYEYALMRYMFRYLSSHTKKEHLEYKNNLTYIRFVRKQSVKNRALGITLEMRSAMDAYSWHDVDVLLKAVGHKLGSLPEYFSELPELLEKHFEAIHHLFDPRVYASKHLELRELLFARNQRIQLIKDFVKKITLDISNNSYLFLRRNYELIRHISVEQIKQTLAAHKPGGVQMVSLPNIGFEHMQLHYLNEDPDALSIEIPMWTAQEHQSDLVLWLNVYFKDGKINGQITRLGVR